MRDQYLQDIIRDVETELGTHKLRAIPRHSFTNLAALAW